MTSSAKFIDYFVHDMLDYTVLTNDRSNFIKSVTRFDIRVAIEEIYQILEDKAYMKEIEIKLNYLEFDDMYLIETDQKRLQQVILNLFSNAIKFTNRQGKIVITAEFKS